MSRLVDFQKMRTLPLWRKTLVSTFSLPLRSLSQPLLKNSTNSELSIEGILIRVADDTHPPPNQQSYANAAGAGMNPPAHNRHPGMK